ncbi:MAG: PAAR-like protein [Planctomycetota bacterium]
MPGNLFHVGATATCPHQGQISVVSQNTRVLVGGQPVATFSDMHTVAGCPFTVPGPKPQPCVTVKWLVPATRVLINGQPALLQTSSGVCQSAEQAPQGPPNVLVTQPRVQGT